MNKMTISASDLKRNISEVLNKVYFNKDIAVVERHGKPIAEITPIEASVGKKAPVTTYFGALPELPEVRKERKFSRKIVDL